MSFIKCRLLVSLPCISLADSSLGMHMHRTDVSCCCQKVQPADSCVLVYSLDMLQAQCELWSSPIAAVAYMPLVKGQLVSMDDAALNGTTVEESKAKLAAFYDAVSHAGKSIDASSTDASSTDRSTCVQRFPVKPQNLTQGAFLWLEFPAVAQGVYTCTELLSCCTPFNETAEKGCTMSNLVAHFDRRDFQQRCNILVAFSPKG